METVDIFPSWSILHVTLFRHILPNNWAIDCPTENIPNNLAVGELGNLWLVNSCWAILFAQPLSISITKQQLGKC